MRPWRKGIPSGSACSRRCRLLAELGEQEEAIKGYKAILELTPGDRNNREEYIDLLCRIGRYEAAVKQLDALCSHNPRDAELQVRLAKTLHQAKQPAKAVEAIMRYLKMSDRSEYAHLRAARLLESFADKKNAGSLYRTTAETFSDSPSGKRPLPRSSTPPARRTMLWGFGRSWPNVPT